MTDVHDPASVLEAAEKAVASGDHAEAERLLRDLAASQEASLGPQHQDLATTLNNLAFVCERTNNLEEAERNYRRAHAIAVASLGPGHPFIATSLRNLTQFCAAHGIPIWKPPADAAAADDEPSDPEHESQADDTPADDTVPPGGQEAWRAPPGHRTIPTATAVAALGVAAIAVVAFLVWRGTAGTVDPEPGLPASAGNEAPASDVPAAVGDEAPAPAASAPPPASEPRREPGQDERPAPASAPIEPPPARDATVAAATVTVLRAQVCSALERTGSPDWQCTPASGELEPGAYIFYTRVLTDVATTVEHRWYHGDRVHQVVELDVTPSPGRGYRTFSRTTVSAERAGDWTVELRAADGTLLQEARFAVRGP